MGLGKAIMMGRCSGARRTGRGAPSAFNQWLSIIFVAPVFLYFGIGMLTGIIAPRVVFYGYWAVLFGSWLWREVKAGRIRRKW